MTPNGARAVLNPDSPGGVPVETARASTLVTHEPWLAPCGYCDGGRQDFDGTPCPECDGSGRVEIEAEIATQADIDHPVTCRHCRGAGWYSEQVCCGQTRRWSDDGCCGSPVEGQVECEACLGTGWEM
jgi:DnaJ-class molecular chaperone